jgi:predicted nuclease with TOPRIM domain
LASLRAENERLLEEVKKYQTSEARMREQIQQQRDELCELGEKLESMHARKSGNA